MKTLIIDLSQNHSLLSLSDGKTLLAVEYLENRSPNFFSVLKKFCDLSSLTALAIGIGPGSYMGIRMAATIGKSLSFALNLPIIEFPSPLCYLPKESGIYTIIGDAKMKELYTMKFSLNENEVKILSKPVLIPKENPPSSDFIIDLQSSPPPNMDWVCKYVHEQFVQGNILNQNDLKLSYLRDCRG